MIPWGFLPPPSLQRNPPVLCTGFSLLAWEFGHLSPSPISHTDALTVSWFLPHSPSVSSSVEIRSWARPAPQNRGRGGLPAVPQSSCCRAGV